MESEMEETNNVRKEIIVDDGQVPGCSKFLVIDQLAVPFQIIDPEEQNIEDIKFNETVDQLREQLVGDIDLQDDDEYIEDEVDVDVVSDSDPDASEDEVEVDQKDSGQKWRRKNDGRKMDRCPHPAPRKGKGRKAQKRKIDDEAVQKEASTVVNILKHRKSLKDDCLGGIEVGPRVDKRLIPLINWTRMSEAKKTNEGILMKQMKFYVGLMDSVNKRMFAEHLRWLFIKSDEFKPEPTMQASTLKLEWVEPFCQKYASLYPMLGDKSPEARILLAASIKTVGSRALHELMKLGSKNFDARNHINDMISFIDRIMKAKLALADKFEKQYNNCTGVNVKLDETSIWGLKPLRLALDRPYFKTEDGILAAPLHPDGVELQEKYSQCFFRRDMQKWTTKDIVALKQCIKEVLIDKKISSVRARYQDLVQDSRVQKAKDEAAAGISGTGSEPVKRKRGRPKKSDVLKEEQYGKIYPLLMTMSDGMIIRSQVTPKLLGEWRTQEERRVKSLSYEAVLKEENGEIDWCAVSQKMIVKTRKTRTDEDCSLAWKHEADPAVKTKRWSMEETKQLKELIARMGHYNYDQIASVFNQKNVLENKPLRTSYQCYFRYRNRIDPPKKMVWDDDKDERAKELIETTKGNWRVVAEMFKDPAATKRQIIERYKKNINPVLRNGAFTRVEDCLLLLTIEKLKPFIAREGHFGSLLAYLPWRFETTWRDRANNLFSDWIVPWTLEEDEKLMHLAVEMQRNWQKISEEFTSFKNRKGCLTRYKILQRRLKDGRYKSLQEYHEAYAMTRYNVFQYKHLKEIVALLKKVNTTFLPEKFRKFPGLERGTPPTEHQLQHMLMTFDTDIVRSTISSLEKYIASRDAYWKGWISSHGKRRRTFDRRTFHADCAQSVASAIHIRDLKLKPKSSIPNLSDFEMEVYKFYAQFCRTKAIKRSTVRPYIPSARRLATWSVIERLVATPVDSLPLDTSTKKFKIKGKRSLMDGDGLENDVWSSDDDKKTPKKRQKKTPTTTTPTGKRRGRPPKNLVLDKVVVPVATPKAAPLVETKPKASKVVKFQSPLPAVNKPLRRSLRTLRSSVVKMEYDDQVCDTDSD